MREDVEKALRASFKNKAAVKASKYCKCYFCRKGFGRKKIREWADGGQTALCPRCGMDTVLPAASGLPIDNIEWLENISYQVFTDVLEAVATKTVEVVDNYIYGNTDLYDA